MAPRFFALLALLWFAPIVRAEVISQFHVDVRLNTDTSMDIAETIVFDPQGAQRHGIFRIIPVVYSRKGGKYTIYLNVQSVTDGKGKNWPYSQTRQGRDISLKIGDPDSYLNGPSTFKIQYNVRRAVNFFEGAPEVYWNATGNEWPFAIENASARFFPPPGVKPDQVTTASFVGPPGGTAPANVQVENDSILFSYQNLPPSDGLTFVAGLPAGSVTQPTALQTFLWFFADWWPAFVLPILTGCLITFLWNTTGRDVEGNLPAQVEWAPPKDLTPAEVGTLIDERCDMADIISTLIDLAARGYLTIEQVQTQSFLFFQNRDYRFHRVDRVHNPEEPPLKPHEQEFLRGLFGSTTAMGTVSLSSLKNNFYTHLPVMETSIYQSLTSKHLFTANPETTRQTYHGAGVVMIVLGAIAAFFGAAFSLLAWGLGLIAAGVIVFLSAKAMPAKTATGSRKLRECVGFQRFVKLAEKDRIEKLVQDDPTIFGRLLPYAMVLGVADEWAGKFADLLREPPDWYVGTSGPFYPHYFVTDLGNGMNQMGQTFSSKPAPESTAGSGGSGFSSGGGFSGGGFGGGGGGSW